MSANVRIQWLHKMIAEFSYPNAMRLSERFNISHRQAQRDVDYLRKTLGAPLAYSAAHKGFYYTTDFSLPVILTSDHDEDFMGVVSSIFDDKQTHADTAIVQTQIPFNATLEIRDKLAAIELRSFILSKESRNRYLCEFQNVERFLSAIMSLEADVRIVSPYWMRERLIRMAKRVLLNNAEESEESYDSGKKA